MIDPLDGSIVFDSGARLDPRQALDVFRRSPLGKKGAKFHPGNAPWTGCTPGNRLIGGRAWHLDLTFEGQRLHSIRLDFELPRGAPRGWDTWSLPDELAKQAEYDRLLANDLGPDRHAFPWGTAGGIFDERAAAASLYVTYDASFNRP